MSRNNIFYKIWEYLSEKSIFGVFILLSIIYTIIFAITMFFLKWFLNKH